MSVKGYGVGTPPIMVYTVVVPVEAAAILTAVGVQSTSYTEVAASPTGITLVTNE